jgi:hypothetical protein
LRGATRFYDGNTDKIDVAGPRNVPLEIHVSSRLAPVR